MYILPFHTFTNNFLKYIQSFPFLVTVCEADSTTNFNSDTDTISYGDQSTESDRESNYYSHFEPEFIENSNSESDSESQNSENVAKVN